MRGQARRGSPPLCRSFLAFASAGVPASTGVPASAGVPAGAGVPADAVWGRAIPVIYSSAPDEGIEAGTIEDLEMNYQTSVTVAITVNPEGVATRVDLGATRHHKTLVSKITNAGDSRQATATTLTIKGLKPKRSYVIQVDAANGAGITQGKTLSARTT